jgi:hypothetical protein
MHASFRDGFRLDFANRNIRQNQFGVGDVPCSCNSGASEHTFRVRSFNGGYQFKRLVEVVIPGGEAFFDYYAICPARRHRHPADDRRPIRL